MAGIRVKECVSTRGDLTDDTDGEDAGKPDKAMSRWYPSRSNNEL